jgi:hypothetical protein
MFRNKNSSLVFAFLLSFVFATYLVPEHYLKHFHPHEHTSCAHQCTHEEETLTGFDQRCDDEKEYFFPPLPGKVLITVLSASYGKVTPREVPEPPVSFFSQIPPRSPPF